MVAIVKVVNESIAVAEPSTGPSSAPGVVTVLQNLSALNDFGQQRTGFWSYPPLIDLVPLDIPSPDEQYADDPHWFAFAHIHNRQAIWEGGFIDVSYDGGLTWELGRAEFTEESRVGFVVDDASLTDRELGDPQPDRWDVYSKVTVEMVSGELASASREEVLSGANLLYINGEIRAFSTATEVTPLGALGIGKTYELSDWIRGLRGSAIVDPLPSMSSISSALRTMPIVVDLTGPYLAIRLPNGDDDVELQYRARARSYSGAEIEGIDIALIGQNLKPFPVTNAAAVKQANDDWIVTWDRVTRNPDPQILAARGIVDADTPSFKVRILDGPGGAVKRTIVATDDTATWTAAEQIVDFLVDQTTINAEIIRTNSWLDGAIVTVQA